MRKVVVVAEVVDGVVGAGVMFGVETSSLLRGERGMAKSSYLSGELEVVGDAIGGTACAERVAGRASNCWLEAVVVVSVQDKLVVHGANKCNCSRRLSSEGLCSGYVCI